MSRVLFRVDGGNVSGLGHVSRCLTIAEILIQKGCECLFLIKTDNIEKIDLFFVNKEVHFIDRIYLDSNNDEFDFILNLSFDFLVLDHYLIDEAYQRKLICNYIKWGQFDYKASDFIYADVVINPNPYAHVDLYNHITRENATKLVGSDYSIIRKEILNAKINKVSNNIFISISGGNDNGINYELLNVFKNYPYYNFYFNITDNTVYRDDILGIISEYDFMYIVKNEADFVDKLSVSSIGITSGGVTLLEMAFLQTPSVILPFMKNQKLNAEYFEKHGLGKSYNHVGTFIDELKSGSFIFSSLNYPKINIVDGKGAERIAILIMDTL